MEIRTTVARVLGLCVPWFVAVWSCTPQQSRPVPVHQEEVRLLDRPAPVGADRVAILAPARPQTEEVHRALIEELGSEFGVVTLTLQETTSAADLGRFLTRINPACVVVMDNRTLGLYRELQRSWPEHRFPPAIVLMTSFLSEVIGTLRNATGIAYEVPAVTSLVALREVVTVDVQRVGVVHRKRFASLVAMQKKLAEGEQIRLISFEVSDQPDTFELDDALLELIDDQAVDALWVLNDNVLLTREMFADAWLVRLEEQPTPVVVGVAALVRPGVPFGTFAVLPNHQELGFQAAGMIFELSDADWTLEEPRVEAPLSVRTIVNVQQVRDYFGLEAGAMKRIDQAVE